MSTLGLCFFPYLPSFRRAKLLFSISKPLFSNTIHCIIATKTVSLAQRFLRFAPDFFHFVSQKFISALKQRISASQHCISDLKLSISASQHCISDPKLSISASQHCISDPKLSISASRHCISAPQQRISAPKQNNPNRVQLMQTMQKVLWRFALFKAASSPSVPNLIHL